MQLQDAAALINNEFISGFKKQVWVELGCGTGTFTIALASLLPEGSIIYGIDKNKNALEKIPGLYKNIMIEKIYGDFLKNELPDNLDGILMANSLHYVKDKESFIKKIKTKLKRSGCFLIVEYNMAFPTPWIPFPINFNSLKKLFEGEGYSIKKLKDYPSIYRREKIYSALVSSAI